MSQAQLCHIPARQGVARLLEKGKTIKIINTYGKQVVDFWAFREPIDTLSNNNEHLSMANTHGVLLKLKPRAGDTLYSTFSAPMMILTEDTTKGDHDTLVSPCSLGRYKLLGVKDWHASCTQNYRDAMMRYNSDLHRIAYATPPAPLNLFMNVPIKEDGSISFEVPTSEAEQYVCLKALMDVTIVMSACPMDLKATNNWNPTGVDYVVLD